MNKSLKTQYSTEWTKIKLNTKERSLQKEMSVKGALSKYSKQMRAHQMKRTFTSTDSYTQHLGRGKNQGKFKSMNNLSCSGKRLKTEEGAHPK